MNKKGRILIVDDDESTCVALSGIIRKKGYEVEIAHSGHMAREIMKADPADLVFLDIKLPDMEGTELLTEWKKNHPGTDCIIITANASVENTVKAFNQGAVAYLVKPPDMDQLFALIKSLMEKQQLREEKLRNELRIDIHIALLKSVRDVSKLILREKEKESLIRGVCDALIKTHGCESS